MSAGTVVVCDDDVVLRSTVSDICESIGLHVVAETDNGVDAIELVRRFGINVVVLDLALRDGPGELRIEALRALDVNPTIVVFTAYAQDADHLVRLGALDVVEKPDFERLTQVLEGVANTREGRPAPEIDEERRSYVREVDDAPPLWRSPSGISAAPDLVRTLRHVENGDSVLVVEPLDLGRIGIEFGALLEADCRLHVGRTLRQTLRVQDLVHASPDLPGFVAVLRGGHSVAAEAAWQRLVARLEEDEWPGTLRGASAQIEWDDGPGAVARALAALIAADAPASGLTRT